MVIYRYVDRIGELLLSPIFLYNIYDHEKYYPGEPFNIHINHEQILSIRTIGKLPQKRGKGKLQLFCGNGNM